MQFDIICRKYRKPILSTLAKLGIPQKDRQDCLQQVYLQVYLSYVFFDPRKGKFERWLNSIVVHEAAHYKDLAYNRKVLLRGKIKGDQKDLEEDYDARSQVTRLLNNIITLPSIEKQMAYGILEGKKVTEIAEDLKMSYSTCAKKVRKVNTRLQEFCVYSNNPLLKKNPGKKKEKLMICFPWILRVPAEKAGIQVPPINPNDLEDQHWEDYKDQYPHFYVYLKLQLGKPMSSPDEIYTNAAVIAALTETEIKNFTLTDLKKLE